MKRRMFSIMLHVVLVAATWQTVHGQDFRVYTTIQNLAGTSRKNADNDGSNVVGRSRTLFHAGKVYDYLPEIDEVVIIDFNSEKPHYTLLNAGRELAATIHFDEVNGKLQEAMATADQSIARMAEQNDPRDRAAVSLYRFQRSPSFDEHLTADRKKLQLSGSLMHYGVECASPPQPAFVDSYCRYADAICRLNYVLHPGVLMPGPRMTLNSALRRHSVLPTTVQLEIKQSPRISLLATHQFRWQLDPSDRQKIDHWESTLASPQTRRVQVRDYLIEAVRVASKK